MPLLPTRLAGGSADGEGHVEVYYNDQWGAVCDDEWDLLDAIVVCSQLGFAGALGATRNSFFDKGNLLRSYNIVFMRSLQLNKIYHYNLMRFNALVLNRVWMNVHL